MLVHLSVHNYAIVEHLDLELDTGMSVISGETGAGKSIMLDALGLTLGNLLFTYSQQFISVDMATCAASVRPFFSAAFATLFLREKLTPRLASGIALVVVGVTVMSL